MKDFFKNVLATIVGLFAFGIICTVLCVMSLIGMIASTQSKQTVKKNSVFVMKLDGEIADHSVSNIFAELQGQPKSIGLNEMVTDIEKAAQNDKIKGIYLEMHSFSGMPATLQELRQSLAKFRKTGKWIVAYGDNYTEPAYYIASVANSVYINPQGMLDWHGLGGEQVYVKDLAAKLGVKFQVFKVGAFKSATEMFTNDKMSAENRLQTETYLKGIWGNMCKDVSASRGISVDTLNALADRYIGFETTDVYKKYKLIDGTLYANEVKKEIKARLGIKEDDDIAQIGFADMDGIPYECANDGDDEIAIYHAEGDIVDEIIPNAVFGGGQRIVATEVCRDLEDLANDDDVKAVVIRINSGGGSAYASEQMWHQITELKKKKPVVVSMGAMAASGGYYMSCNANWIVAQPTTLTGSIGIFGVLPDVSALMTQKLGLKFDEVKTNRNTTMFSSSRPMSVEECAIMQRYINHGYRLFSKRVCDGRKMQPAELEKIAGGHVWLGTDALKIRLVDQLGSLDDAIAKAAQLAKVKNYHTAGYPAPVSWSDQLLLRASGNDNYLDEGFKMALGTMYEPVSSVMSLRGQSRVQARVPYYLILR